MVKMNKPRHYLINKEFNNVVFKDSFNVSNIEGNGNIQHFEKVWTINEGTLYETTITNKDHRYWKKMSKNNQKYIVPVIYLEKMPFEVQEEDIEPIRLKRNDSNVYYFVKDVESLKIPIRKTYDSVREFVDNWNNIEVKNDFDATLMKMVAMVPDLKMGICGNTGSIKNANTTLVNNLIGGLARITKPPTSAVFWQTIKYNRTIVVDEITSWSNVEGIEDYVALLGDDSTDGQKHSLDQNNHISVEELSDKGLIFTFNPITDKNKNSFHSKFENADKILDRFPLIMIENEVISAPKKPSLAQRKEIMMEQMDVLKKDASMLMYVMSERISENLHHYDRGLNPFKVNVRWEANTSGLIDFIDAYCNSQEEFDYWMRGLKERMLRYDEMAYQNEQLTKKYEEMGLLD